MIADMIRNKKLDSVVNELFIRERKLNISLAFITQSYFKIPKDVRLNNTHFFIAKNLKQKTTSTNCDKPFIRIRTEDFINIHRKCTGKPYSFLVVDTTLASNNPLRFRKIVLKYGKNHDN